MKNKKYTKIINYLPNIKFEKIEGQESEYWNSSVNYTENFPNSFIKKFKAITGGSLRYNRNFQGINSLAKSMENWNPKLDLPWQELERIWVKDYIPLDSYHSFPSVSSELETYS